MSTPKIWSIKYQIWPMTHSMKNSEKMTKLMDMVGIIMQMEQHTKVIGNVTNGMSEEKYVNKYIF